MPPAGVGVEGVTGSLALSLAVGSFSASLLAGGGVDTIRVLGLSMLDDSDILGSFCVASVDSGGVVGTAIVSLGIGLTSLCSTS